MQRRITIVTACLTVALLLASMAAASVPKLLILEDFVDYFG